MRWLKTTVVSVAVSIVLGEVALACQTVSEAPKSTKPLVKVQHLLDDYVRKIGAPGASLAFVVSDGRAVGLATGVSNKSSTRRMQPDDRMFSGSIGKTYVAAVALQLLEEKRLELDARISRWFGDEQWFKRLPNHESVTLRMLLNHTSGIPEHVWFPEFLAAVRADQQKVWRPEELIEYVLDKPALFPAGEGWSYADTNYILVGMIIERVTGRKYYTELKDRLLKPLKLTDTLPSDRPALPGLISGYTTKENPFGLPIEVVTGGRCAFNPQMEWTGGGLISTPLDLARWAHTLYGGDVLSQKSRELMLRTVEAGPRLGPGKRYGLGVITRLSRQGPVYGHSGFFPGYISAMAYYADHQLALAIQLNTEVGVKSAELEDLLDDIAAELIERGEQTHDTSSP